VSAPDFLDHSILYRRGFMNIPHRARLKAIVRTVVAESPPSPQTYADVGCSTGHVTAVVAQAVRPGRVYGLDQARPKLEEAARRYPEYSFSYLNLDAAASHPDRFQLVTCFETLEHTGTPQRAMENLIALTRDDGVLVVTVPIEIGPIGVAKFVAKTMLGRRDIDELPEGLRSSPRYLAALLSGRRMSYLRDQRHGWANHFGFDHRDLDDWLEERKIPHRAFNTFTTRFYVIRPGSGQPT
jgi:SAM-dependent methyltransferase